MAITTLAGIESGEVGSEYLVKPTSANGTTMRPQNLLYVGGGFPANATPNAAGLSGAAVTSFTGQIRVPPASGNTYIKAVNVASQSTGTLVLCDLLWHNSGLSLTLTTSQTINSVTMAARDDNGTSNGAGVYAALVITGATGSGTPVISLGYTNQDNTAGRSSNTVTASLASTVAGATYIFALQAGDTGIRSIQTYQQTATWTSGTAHLILFRVLLTVPVYSPVRRYMGDITENGLTRIYDNSVPFGLFFSSGSSMANLAATIEYTQG